MEMVEPELKDSNAPVCSVCIANYNGLDIIAECIESVLAQDCGFPIEIIVHDDASTDGSAEFIRTQFPQVRLIESRENVGFCISNNRMAALSRGEYLLLLNNDAALLPGALITLRNNAISIGRPAIFSLPQYNAETGQLIDVGCFLDPFLNPIPNLNIDQDNVGMVIGACFWIPKTLWDELGGFPEWFGSLAEDMLLCCVARMAGYPVRVANDSGYKHWVGHSFGGGKAEDNKLVSRHSRRRLSERNKNFVMTIYYPLPILILILPIHLTSLLIEGAVLALASRSWKVFIGIYWHAAWCLYTYRAEIIELRHRVQARRIATVVSLLRSSRLIPQKVRLLLQHGMPTLK